jgi:hypothetical protein
MYCNDNIVKNEIDKVIINVYNDNTMNLSKRSRDKELFSGEQSSKENTKIAENNYNKIIEIK